MTTREERRQELRAEMERRRDRTFRAAQAWRTRARRRGIVIAATAVLVVSAVAAHLDLDGHWWLLLAGAVIYFALIAALRPLTRAVADSFDSQLDERDRALRDHVVGRAYWIVGCTLAALLLYAVFTEDLPGFASRVEGLLIVIVWGMSFAPTLVLGWVLPDDDPEDLAEA